MTDQEELYRWFIKQDIKHVQFVEDGTQQAAMINAIIKELTHISDEQLLQNIMLFQKKQDSIGEQKQKLQKQMNELIKQEQDNFKHMYEQVLMKI